MRDAPKKTLKEIMLHEKKYQISGIDEFHQLEETPASREITETRRFYISAGLTLISAVAAIVAAIAAVISCIS